MRTYLLKRRQRFLDCRRKRRNLWQQKILVLRMSLILRVTRNPHSRWVLLCILWRIYALYTGYSYSRKLLQINSSFFYLFQEILVHGKPATKTYPSKEGKEDNVTAYVEVKKDINALTREEQMDVLNRWVSFCYNWTHFNSPTILNICWECK